MDDWKKRKESSNRCVNYMRIMAKRGKQAAGECEDRGGIIE